jgi:hypothetical protein
MKSCKLTLIFIVCLLVAVSYAQLPAPVGHWTFDEGEGFTPADASGNGNDGWISESGVTWTTDTPTGTGFALEFAGSQGAVHIGDPEILQIIGDITLAAWVKTGAATGQWHNIIAKGHGNGEIVMRLDGNGHPSQFWCGSYDTADHMASSADLTEDQLNTWIHLVGTYDSNAQEWSLYFNGELVASKSDPIGAVTVNMPWAIGARSNVDAIYPTERHFTGCIDDARIYNVPLTADDVLQLYNEITTSIEQKIQPLPSHYNLSQNYPNPFNPETRIEFDVVKSGNVKIQVYNIFGQSVAKLVDEAKAPGHYSIKWNATDQKGMSVSEGIYFCKMTADGYTKTISMLLMK